MGYRDADRVKETTTTTGTGTYSLAGAVAGFQTFVAGYGTGNRCTYCVEDGTNWEINEGIITDATPDTLTRTKFLASSTGSAINWSAGTRNIFSVYAAVRRNPRTKKLLNNHDNLTTTGTEVTELTIDLEPGTYHIKWVIINRSSVTTTGVGIGINFTGTITAGAIVRRSVSTITTAANGITEEESGVALVTGGVINAWASKSLSTTAPNMMSAGVGAINVSVVDIIEAIFVITVAGDLQIWHSSETANSTLFMAGSCVICTRIDD